MKMFINFFNLLRTIPIAILIEYAKGHVNKELIWNEIFFFGGVTGSLEKRKLYLLRDILWCYPEFRNLLQHRFRFLYSNMTAYGICRLLWGKKESLDILTECIGPNLFIQHGNATVIAAKSIGKNCWINQQVTLGYTDANKCPIIKDNVHIYCGAKVLGEVIVEDYAVVGAGAVVLKDVPYGKTAVGVPAHIVVRD